MALHGLYYILWLEHKRVKAHWFLVRWHCDYCELLVRNRIFSFAWLGLYWHLLYYKFTIYFYDWYYKVLYLLTLLRRFFSSEDYIWIIGTGNIGILCAFVGCGWLMGHHFFLIVRCAEMKRRILFSIICLKCENCNHIC